MIKGEKVRFDIHNILFSIYKFNNTLESTSIKKIIDKHKKEDVSFIFNVTLNSMRLHIHSLKILKKYIKKKLRDHEKILLISAITQIVFLDFKEYAVINCTVEISKRLKIILYKQLLSEITKLFFEQFTLTSFASKFEDSITSFMRSRRFIFLTFYINV